jgi:UDP-N-acetylmuramoyl-tripeptide--D-alanyl-D-alanine ligase
MMRNLSDALSSGRRGGYAGGQLSSNRDAGRRRHHGQGRALGRRAKTIVNALETRFSGTAALDNAAI